MGGSPGLFLKSSKATALLYWMAWDASQSVGHKSAFTGRIREGSGGGTHLLPWRNDTTQGLLRVNQGLKSYVYVGCVYAVCVLV